MKILLGNNTLSLLAGSETWTLTLARQLKQLGHHVACYSPSLGIIAKQLEDSDIHSYDSLAAAGMKPFTPYFERPVDHRYDIIIANHWHIVEYLRSKFPKTPIISTIHGIMHKNDDGSKAPEHPALDAGVNQFVAVSEEVQQMLKEEYGLDSIVIRNFFDIPKLAGMPGPKERPAQILINTNYNGKGDPEIEVLRQAAKRLGMQVAAVGENFAQSIDVVRAIQDADIVVGMGRSVLEGVAAGRLGIVHGRWGTGGVICESNIPDLAYYNFSGRNSKGKMATVDEFVALIERYYQPQIIEAAQKYVKTNHNVVFAADAYLRLADELTGASVNRARPSAVAPDTHPLRLAKP